jgi:hypothetical protein
MEQSRYSDVIYSIQRTFDAIKEEVEARNRDFPECDTSPSTRDLRPGDEFFSRLRNRYLPSSSNTALSPNPLATHRSNKKVRDICGRVYESTYRIRPEQRLYVPTSAFRVVFDLLIVLCKVTFGGRA